MGKQNQHLLGTAVLFSASLVIKQPGSPTATITIVDSNDGTQVNAVAMTDTGENSFDYVWQSGTSDPEGTYEATITITMGSYVAIKKHTFYMSANENAISG